DKTFQSATTAKHTNQHIARIYLREPAGRQLEHVVGGAVSESPNHDDIAGSGCIGSRNERDSFRKGQRRRSGSDLVDVNDIDGFGVAGHRPPPNRSRNAFSLMKPSASRWL